LNEFPPDEVYVSSYSRALKSLELLISGKDKIFIDTRLDERKTTESFEDVKKSDQLVQRVCKV